MICSTEFEGRKKIDKVSSRKIEGDNCIRDDSMPEHLTLKV